MTDNQKIGRLGYWTLAVLPIVAIAVVVWVFAALSPLDGLTGNQPPVEDVAVSQVFLESDGIALHVVNSGPEPVRIAQVQVDEAYWSFDMTPKTQTLPRLGRGTIRIPYPWVDGELHEVRLVSSTGATFDHTIEVATLTPKVDLYHWAVLGVVGFFVGIVPVGLGLLWLPLLGRLKRSGLHFILALTVGLLLFLLVDSILEGIEFAEAAPDVFRAVPMVFFAVIMSFVLLVAVGNRSSVRDRSSRSGRMWVATAIALGIGLHNLGEGMAIGATIALGQAALGSFLVIGFMIHNVTEGVGIGAPIAEDRPGLPRLIGLTLLAGAPAIVGVWIGAFAFTPLLGVLFLAIGAGAILQVIYEVLRLLLQSVGDEHSWQLASLATWPNIGGALAGLAIMYLTALLVV